MIGMCYNSQSVLYQSSSTDGLIPKFQFWVQSCMITLMQDAPVLTCGDLIYVCMVGVPDQVIQRSSGADICAEYAWQDAAWYKMR